MLRKSGLGTDEILDLPIEIERTSSGWQVNTYSMDGVVGECDEEGNPGFFQILNRDNFLYPHQVSDFLGELWRYCDSSNPTEEFILKNIAALGKWINATEEFKPVPVEFNY